MKNKIIFWVGVALFAVLVLALSPLALIGAEPAPITLYKRGDGSNTLLGTGVAAPLLVIGNSPTGYGTLRIASGGTLDIASGAIVNFPTGLIPWASVDKTGSSLADLTTRSAGDLSSGTLFAARLPAFTGDATSNAGTAALTLATVNSNVGTFASFTVNGKGLVTAATALSGDMTTSGAVATLATVNGNVGTFAAHTVNAKGLATAAANLSGDLTTSGAVATLATVNSNVGTFAGITLNAKGLATAASALTIATAAPLAGGGTLGNLTISMPASTNSVDGYLTAADHTTFVAKQPAGNYITALTGDVTAAGPGSVAATLATVATGATTGGSTAIPVITFNNKGLVTAVTTAAVVAPAGTLTGTTLAANVVTSSLTGVGTLTGGATGAGFTINLGTSTISGLLGLSNGGTNASTAQNALFNLSASEVVSTIAALKALTVSGLTTGFTVTATGYYANGDGGGGLFYYSSGSSATDNGGTIIQPTVGVGRWLRVFDGQVSVRWFGAKGDGATDDSLAIQNAMQVAANHTAPKGPNGTVYFPKSIYLVNTPALLSSVAYSASGSTTTGLRFSGDGMYNSVIRCNFSSGGWLFDNQTSATDLQQTQFDNLGFEGMDPASYTGFSSLPANVGLFKMFKGALASQGFLFKACRFDLCTWSFDYEGANNCSEIKFIECKFLRNGGPVYTINNPQAFNHVFIACDIEQVFNDVFLLTTGGAIQMFGGSVIMFADGTSTDRWFFHQTGSTGLGAYPFSFVGLRMELRGNYSNLFSVATTTETNLNFIGSMFELQSSVDKTSFGVLGGYATAYLDKCTFFEAGAGKMDWLVTTSLNYNENGTIRFLGCGLGVDWSDRCSLTSTFGQIQAVNCYGLNIGAPTDLTHWAHDFDLNGVSASAGVSTSWATSGASIYSMGSRTDNLPRLKQVYLKVPTDYWTITTTPQEQLLKLPKNAIIRNIYVLKATGGSDGNLLTWVVGNSDKSVPHLTCPSTRNDTGFKASLNDYFYSVGTTTNERTLRLYVTAGTPSATEQGGLVVVEYY